MEQPVVRAKLPVVTVRTASPLGRRPTELDATQWYGPPSPSVTSRICSTPLGRDTNLRREGGREERRERGKEGGAYKARGGIV